jgi:hypothetical protein
MQDISVFCVGKTVDAPHIATRWQELVNTEVLLDAVFDLIGQLYATDGKELDSVVGSRIVGRRNHHAEVGREVSHEECRCRRWDHSRVEHVDSGACQASAHRRGQELATHPRIPRDDARGATAFCATLVGVATAGQNDGGRLSESEG